MVGLNNFSNIFGIFLLTVSSRLSNALHGPLNVGIISKASPINLSQEHFPARFVNPWQPKGIFRMQNKEIVTSCTKVNQKGSMFHTTHLKNSGNDFNENEDLNSSRMAESDQALLGILGTFAGLVTLYSEFTLKSTGCGLPAGPYGLVGAVEGISYLTIVGIAGLAAYTKFETVRYLTFFGLFYIFMIIAQTLSLLFFFELGSLHLE